MVLMEGEEEEEAAAVEAEARVGTGEESSIEELPDRRRVGRLCWTWSISSLGICRATPEAPTRAGHGPEVEVVEVVVEVAGPGPECAACK